MNAFLALLGLLSMLGTSSRPQLHYIDIQLEDWEELRQLREAGMDVGGINYEHKLATLIGYPEDFRLREFPVVQTRSIGRSPDPEYKNYKEVEDRLIHITREYPHLSSLEVIGKSIQDRNIYAVRLTNHFVIPPGGKKEKETVLFDAMHHSREVMTVEVALDIIEQLTKNFESDADIRKWMNQYVIWVVPMLNPDGNHKVWNTNAMWRKNARGGYGVDINRNYPYDWGRCQGSSGNTNEDTYRGPSAASEPEAKALMDLAADIKPKFNISYHTFSEIVIYPFGCYPKRIPAAHRKRYEDIGKELGRRLVRDSGNGYYQAGTSYELLYNVDGGSLDWMYDEHKILSYVVEVNSTVQGFQPSYSWRDRTVKKQRPGWRYILDLMDKPGLR